MTQPFKEVQSYSLRLVRESAAVYEKTNSPRDIVDMINNLYDLKNRPEEHAIIVALDIRLNPIGIFMMAHGGTNCAIVEPAAIFRRLLLCNASAFALVHNHPSGSCEPSAEDTALAHRLEKAGILLNIKMCDSLTVGAERFHSHRTGESSRYVYP